MKWFVLAAVLVAGSWVVWALIDDGQETQEPYEVVELERHGTTIKLAKNAEFCTASMDGYFPIPDTAEYLGPHVYAAPMPDDPGVYMEIYLTDAVTGARAAGRESCWTP